MILILGKTHDDILYFENIMHNKQEEKVFDKYTVTTGTIYNQNVCLMYDIYSNYLSSLIVTHLIRTKYVIFVILVGKEKTYFDDLKVGDIVISNSITLGDVDFTSETKCKLGQIPSFPQTFLTQTHLAQIFDQSISKVLYREAIKGNYISTSRELDNVDQIKYLNSDDFVLGMQNNVVFDTESGGAAIACNITDVPLIAIKVIESKVGEKSSLENYLTVLKSYIDVGKGVSIAISEVGRNDFIQ